LNEETVLVDEGFVDTSIYVSVVVSVVVVAAPFVSLAEAGVLDPPFPLLLFAVLEAADALADSEALVLAEAEAL
jgi:hypothetical protein